MATLCSHNHVLPLVAVLTGSLAGGAPAVQQDPTGTWIGQWEREGSILPVEMTFSWTDSGYAGSFSSAQLRVVGIPFARIRFEDPTLRWDLPGDATMAQFEGTMTGDSLAGRFQDGAAAGTFRATRGIGTDPGVREEEVAFANGSVTLSGTAVYPPGPGPFAGIVFVHGSGAEGRWASRFLANAFARRGVAALIYDKRGVGRSTGDWREADFADLVGDAAAAVEALRSQPRVAPDRVGIHGHSQGGTIVPWVASENPHVAFVVASAGGGTSMAETELYSVGNAVGLRSMDEAERPLAERYVRAIVETAYHGAPRAALEAAYREVQDRAWAFAPPAESDFYWAFSRRIASYDPLAYWRRVAAPAFLAYGEGDERVPPRLSAARITEAYLGARGSRLEVVLFAGADHTYRMPPTPGAGFEWPRTAAGYPDPVIDWVLRVADP